VEQGFGSDQREFWVSGRSIEPCSLFWNRIEIQYIILSMPIMRYYYKKSNWIINIVNQFMYLI
jgi:hypothetical protein